MTWAVEGIRHYGLGLARHLGAQGEYVSEIDTIRRGHSFLTVPASSSMLSSTEPNCA